MKQKYIFRVEIEGELDENSAESEFKASNIADEIQSDLESVWPDAKVEISIITW